MPATTTRSGRRLSALWETDRAQAIREVKDALISAGGDAERAAFFLGVSRRTIFRWKKKHPELQGVTLV